MLRQAMFSLVAGGLIGWGVSLVILRNNWLTLVTIRFLRIAMWFPFLAVYAVHDWFMLGIAAAALAAIYQYLAARSFLEFSSRDAFQYAAGEVTVQSLLFTLLAQVWVGRWSWQIFSVNSDAAMGFTVLALVVTLVLLINWIFRRNFLAACTRLAIQRNKELFFLNEGSIPGIALLTLIWLLFWELTCSVFLYDGSGSFSAIQGVSELLFTHDAWRSIFVSLKEIGGGVLFGGLLALTVSTAMHRSEKTQYAIAKILPATFLSPIGLWILVFYFCFQFMDEISWSRSFVVGVGYKMMGVGLLIFFPLVQTLWAFRDALLLQRGMIAVENALPIAFIAMLVGELFGATAGLGFQMIVASATFQYQQSLGYFLITVLLLSTSSMILRLIVKLLGLQAVQPHVSEAK